MLKESLEHSKHLLFLVSEHNWDTIKIPLFSHQLLNFVVDQ